MVVWLRVNHHYLWLEGPDLWQHRSKVVVAVKVPRGGCLVVRHVVASRLTESRTLGLRSEVLQARSYICGKACHATSGVVWVSGVTWSRLLSRGFQRVGMMQILIELDLRSANLPLSLNLVWSPNSWAEFKLSDDPLGAILHSTVLLRSWATRALPQPEYETPLSGGICPLPPKVTLFPSCCDIR